MIGGAFRWLRFILKCARRAYHGWRAERDLDAGKLHHLREVELSDEIEQMKHGWRS